jgi:hypothetical protein
LKCIESKEQNLLEIKRDPHLHQTFLKMWKLTIADLLVIRADDLPTVQVPYTRFFDLMALIERAFYYLRPELIAVLLQRPEQHI